MRRLGKSIQTCLPFNSFEFKGDKHEQRNYLLERRNYGLYGANYRLYLMVYFSLI